jgi:hypothetical protein
MAICTLAVLSLAVAMTAGWRLYFQLRDERQMILRVAASLPTTPTPPADDPGANASEAASKLLLGNSKPEVSMAALPDPAVPTPSLMGKENPQAVSLVDIAKTETSGKSMAAAAPVPEVVLPKQLDAATDVLQKFWHAPSLDVKAQYVLNPERVKPLMREYYEVQHHADPQSGKMLNSGGYRINGRSVLVMSFSSARPGDVLEMALLPIPGGSYLIDWESYVGYSEMAWADFKKQRTAKPTLFRCYASKSDYYNYEFADDKKFMSYNLLSPDGLYSVHAYCERDSNVGRALGESVNVNAQYMGLTLRLAFPEKAESDHCVRIVGVVADRWMVLADAP